MALRGVTSDVALTDQTLAASIYIVNWLNAKVDQLNIDDILQRMTNAETNITTLFKQFGDLNSAVLLYTGLVLQFHQKIEDLLTDMIVVKQKITGISYDDINGITTIMRLMSQDIETDTLKVRNNLNAATVISVETSLLIATWSSLIISPQEETAIFEILIPQTSQ